MRKKLIYHLSLIAILAALSSVLRIWLVALPNIKPITAMFFAFILFLGLSDSLWIMSITMLTTGLLLGFSPLVFGQIFVYALLMIIFKLLSKIIKNIWTLSILTGSLALLYGFLISLCSGILYGFGPAGFIGYWLAGLPFDLAHAVSTFLFFPIVLLIFKRIKALR